MSSLSSFGLSRKQVGIGIAVLFFIILLSKSVIVVPAGHVGVLEFFGKIYDRSLDAGLHVINPLLKVHEMNVRTQQLTEETTVPSKEGLVVNLDLSVLFRLDSSKAPEVFRTIGPNYMSVVLVPQLRSVVRGVTAEYEAKALYTAEREALANKMNEQLKPMIDNRGLILEKVLLRSVKLPEILSTAIEKKLEAEQSAEQMKFVLQRETQEAERKRIEAKGISDYNKQVGDSLSPEVLRLRGMEATKELASSQNSKIVVIGSGKDGLPLILGEK